MAQCNKVLYNIDQRTDTTDDEKARARGNIGAESPYRRYDAGFMWETEHINDPVVNVILTENNCDNIIDITLNSNHPELCAINITLPFFSDGTAYRMSFEINITNDGGSSMGGNAVVRMTSNMLDDDGSMLAEFAQDGLGNYLTVPLNRVTLPADGGMTRHKVYVDDHAFRVVRLA